MKEDSEELVSVTSAGGVRRGLGTSASQEGSGAYVSRLDRWLATKMLQALGSPPVRLTLWDGSDVTPCPAEPVARVYIADRPAFLKLLFNPELQFGELFSTDRVRVEGDLVRFLEAIYQAESGNTYGELRGRILQWVNRPRKNTLVRSRDNIHQHYDIGNDFYCLWLDKEMVYTCAYFPAPEVSLEGAQVAKLDHVCRKLRLQPGETVVEAGCGWGGLARHMAKHYGVKVRAFNMSPMRGSEPDTKDWMAGSSTWRPTTAASQGSTTCSYRSACWSTWASSITRSSGGSWRAASRETDGVLYTASAGTGQLQ